MLEKYIVCDACGLRSPSFESSSLLYITPTYTSSMQESITQGMQQKLESPAFDARRTLGMSNLIIFNSLQNIWLSLWIDLDILTTILPKIDAPYLSIWLLYLSLHKFSLQPTIDHHGPSMYYDHYTAPINCCKNILLQRQQKYGVWNDWYPKLLYCLCLCGNV